MKLLSLLLGVLAALIATIKGLSELYDLYKTSNSTFVVTIDKNVDYYSPSMFNWAHESREYLELKKPDAEGPVIERLRSENTKAFQSILSVFDYKSNDLFNSRWQTHGSPGHYGSITVIVQNKTNTNFDRPVLNISGLESFDYWTYEDDFLSSKQRSEFDKTVQDFGLENKQLVIQLPPFSNGGKFQFTVWGKEAPWTDADLKGVGQVKKIYLVKVEDSAAMVYARHPLIVVMLLLLTAVFAFAVSGILKTKAELRQSSPAS
ncbi:MAG TPA: hypothetical protein VG759_20210 [Candidatus Angelobacter sp.]|nr:hypothetical protein [Candidatus Angelobacter sp.]